MHSLAYLLTEQVLLLYICVGCFYMTSGRRYRERSRREWEEDHPNLSWDDWKNR